MTATRPAKIMRMAAPAAIFVLLPGVALAEVCDKNTPPLNLLDYLPALNTWVLSNPDGEQIKMFFTPGSLITGAILVWLLFSSSIRPALVAVCWFALKALVAAVGYFTLDLSSAVVQASIAEGCIEGTPRHILSNLGFAVIAGLLTWQRLRQQKTG